MTDILPLMILGSGPAGATAAIYAARAGLKPTLVRGNQPGGQLTITTDVENYPGFADAIQGPWLVEQMEKQAAHHGTVMVSDHIVKADLSGAVKVLHGQSGTTYLTKCLIISTGASAKWLGLDAEKMFNGRGVSACATCDGAFYRNRVVAVVGGGNSAMEEALYLANICAKVFLIHRRDALRGERVLQQRVAGHPRIEMCWNSVVDDIVGDTHPVTGGVTGLRLKNTLDGTLSELPLDGVFIAIGHSPNTALFRDQLDMDDTGYLQVAPGTVQALRHGAAVPGIFAAGDVADSVYRQAVTAAGLGCMAALDANRYLETL